MLRRLELWADRNFKQAIIFLAGIMAGATLVYLFQTLGGVVCPEVLVGTMP